MDVSMSKKIRMIVGIVLIITTLLLILSGCTASTNTTEEITIFSNYKEIPGVTQDEIDAIEALREQFEYFIYAMPHSTEAFTDRNGEVGGFSALFCEWLTQLFDIPFKPYIYDWLDILEGLETGEISFTGDLIATEERKKTYSMTSAIATRHIKAYRLIDHIPLDEIAALRPVRYGFMEGTATIERVTSYLTPGTFETVTLSDFESVYDALKTGRIDIYLYSEVAEVNFEKHPDIVVLDYFPLIYVNLSMATQTPLLEPIITVVEKAIQNNAITFLVELYNSGYHEYIKNKLYNQLTEEEREYINNNPIINVAAIYSNYPISFFNARENEWQGIFFDLLREIESVTDLTFTQINDEHTEWSAIQEMLRTGDASIVAEMIWTREREEHFIWSETVIENDQHALISRSDFHNISINEIYYTKVGLARGTAYTAMFFQWFPGHENYIEYDGIEESFTALQNGDVDLVMTTERRLMFLTHYQELSGFKINYVFDHSINTRLGFNKEETTLRSIIDKALGVIDTKGISNRWMRTTFDYRAMLAEAQRPWIVGAFVSLFFIIIIIMSSNSRDKKKQRIIIEAEMANRTKSTFLAGMSHEIRTPMNSIVGFSELALDEEMSPKAKNYLTSIFENAEGLLQIIDDILDISKIEAGKIELEHVPFLPQEILDTCRTIILPKALEKGLALRIYAEPLPGKMPVGDPTRLRQILVNLMSNAVKFTAVGSVCLNAVVKSINENTATVFFEIKDTGIGMDKEQIQKIFEPFMQAESGTTRKYGGTGLGLSITKNLLEMMNGELTVESNPGTGSKFSFELTFDTIIINDEEFVKKQIGQSKLKKPTFDGEILLCEDNEMNRQVACEHLSRIGLKTTVAENGKIGVEMMQARQREALNNTESKQFDLIFMDMHMPVMDGIEATAEIRTFNTDIPIVAMTANIMADDREQYMMNGINDYLGKPFTSQELWRCLVKYIEPIKWQTEDETQDDDPDDEIDNDLRIKIINNFVNNNKTKFKEIELAIETGDIKLAHRLVHTLKGNAGQLRKSPLLKAADEVEKALKNNTNLVTQEQMNTLNTQLEAVINDLITVIKKSETANDITSNIEALDSSTVIKILNELEILLKDNDSEYLSYTEVLKTIPNTETLIIHIENFDPTPALDSLRNLKNTYEQT